MGLLLRLAALPYPGTGDVMIWKVWAYSGAVVGTSRMYGVGGTSEVPSQYHMLRSALSRPSPTIRRWRCTSWAPRRAYTGPRRSNRWENSAAFTVFIKSIPVVFEAALCALLFVALRRTAGDDAARWAVVVYWLNPAAIINASFGGYLDPLFVLPAVGALMAATAGRPMLAGCLIAASILTKPQGIFIVPAVMLALWNAAESGARHRRIVAGAAGAILVSGAVIAPYVTAGAWWNMVHGISSQATEIFVSMDGYNFWWIAGHAMWVAYAWQRGLDAWAVFMAPVERIPFVRAAAHGLPFLRVAGTMLALAGIGWGLWIGRRARDLPLVAAVAAFSVHAYVTLGAQVHENHLFAAMPLLVVAAATRRRFAPILAGVSAFLALSMVFYMFGAEESQRPLSRSLTLVDTTLLLAVFNCGLFVWHALVLRSEARV